VTTRNDNKKGGSGSEGSDKLSPDRRIECDGRRGRNPQNYQNLKKIHTGSYNGEKGQALKTKKAKGGVPFDSPRLHSIAPFPADDRHDPRTKSYKLNTQIKELQHSKPRQNGHEKGTSGTARRFSAELSRATQITSSNNPRLWVPTHTPFSSYGRKNYLKNVLGVSGLVDQALRMPSSGRIRSFLAVTKGKFAQSNPEKSSTTSLFKGGRAPTSE